MASSVPLNTGTVAQTVAEHTGVVAVNSTTKFEDDAAVVEGVPNKVKRLAARYHQAQQNYVGSDIETFLSKPRVLVRGSLSAADTVTTFNPFVLPADQLMTDIYKAKLKGYLGFRADMVATLQVNATRFQAGRYMLTWLPLAGSRGKNTANTTAWIKMHSCTLRQRTQLPHVEVDLNCDTTATLRIPFSSALDYFPLSALADANAPGSWGVLRLYPYVPLRAVTGETTCTYTIWIHFENVELIGPSVPFVELQSGRINPSEKEAANEGVGPISSTMFKISKAAGYFNEVPVVSQYSSTLSWVSNILGNAASVFGWAAPVNLEHVTRVSRVEGPYSTNVNKVDNSFPLSLDVANQVDALPGFGSTDQDELDISYLSQIPFHHTTFLWSTTNVAGTKVWGTYVSPASDVITLTVDTLPIKIMGPCQYISQKFNFWRGSMTYKIKFVKTEFHSGRLAVAFNPLSLGTSQHGLTSLDSTDYVLRDIIDIRETNVYEVTVPYIANRPYIPTSGPVVYSGELGIYVVDALVAPDTVPQTIDIVVEVCTGPDIEFAGYKGGNLIPDIEVEYQSMELNQCALSSGMIGNARPPSHQLETAQAAIGERIKSLRLLLKKFDFVDTIGSTSAPADNVCIKVEPYTIPTTRRDSPTVHTAEWTPGLLGELSSCFAFGRGGCRVKFIPTSADAKRLVARLIPRAATHPSVYAMVAHVSSLFEEPSLAPHNLNRGTFVMMNAEENIIEVQLPQYTRTHSRSNADLILSSTLPMFTDVGALNSPYYLAIHALVRTVPEGYPINGVLMRAAADDFNLSGFISIPPML